MRFLHTADWHVGKSLRGRSRAPEHEAALAQILDVAKSERVDAVLIAGDTFDSAMPSPEAEKLVFSFLAECCGAGISVVLIAGNHDHPRKLAALTRLLDRLRIFVRAEPAGPEQGGIVELSSRDGSEHAAVAALPFVPERRIVHAAELLNPEAQWYQQYADKMGQMLAYLARGFRPSAVNVMLAHVLIDGARVGGGERELHISQVYALTPQMIPAGAHYVGLGHLHRPQAIAAPSPATYAGSILQLDFGEVDQGKRVVLVDAHPGRPAEIRSLPLTASRRLVDFTGTLAELQAKAKDLRGTFVRVVALVPGPEPGVAERVRDLVPDAVQVRVATPASDGAAPAAGTPALSGLGPSDLLREFYRRRRGGDVPASVLALFERLYEEQVLASA